jgi:hypothetical protein
MKSLVFYLLLTALPQDALAGQPTPPALSALGNWAFFLNEPFYERKYEFSQYQSDGPPQMPRPALEDSSASKSAEVLIHHQAELRRCITEFKSDQKMLRGCLLKAAGGLSSLAWAAALPHQQQSHCE